MKKVTALLLSLCLLLSMTVLGESNIVLCLNCTVKGTTSFYASNAETYTAFAVLGADQAVLEWHINGKVVAGKRDSYLTFSVNGDTVVEAILGSPEEAQKLIKADEEAAREKVIIRTIGAKLQYADKSGAGSGESYTELDFTYDYVNPVTGKEMTGGTAAFKVTADQPHSDRIAYWVIDGVRYDFSSTVKTMNFSNVTHSMTIECVYKNKKSATYGSSDYLKTPEKNKPLVVKSVNAKIRHVRNTGTGDSPAMNEFDFTNNYKNLATGKTANGGLIDVKVYTTVNDSTKIRSWDFDDANVIFNNSINYMFVRGLNTSKTYTAHYDGEAVGTTPEGQNEDRSNYCTVDCRSATFSGGGYSGARKGDVPAGTTVTVTSSIGPCEWIVGGEKKMIVGINKLTGEERESPLVATSITLTIRRWTIVQAVKP